MARAGRIRAVVGGLEVGGTERHLSQVLPALARRGWQVEVHCLGGRGAFSRPLEEAGIRVIEPPGWTARLGQAARLTLSGARLWATFLKDRSTPTHFFLPKAYLVGGVAALLALSRAPRLMSRRSLNDYQRSYAGAAALERALHHTTTLILGNSRAVVRQLRAEGVTRDKLEVLYNGIDLQPFARTRPREETRRELGLRPAEVALVAVANLIAYKGHADLLEALARLPDRLADQWVLLCVGGDRGIGPELRRRAAQLGVERNIRWLGSRSDVPDLLTASDLLVLPSHQEGFSNAILEGMAAGLPVIASDVGGNREAVVDGQSGLLVPARDPDSLAEALRELLDDRDRARAMGLRGRARVASRFSLESCVDEYERLYRSILDGRLAEDHPPRSLRPAR